ncbi:MAG TPA: polysaccharide deacetylase family protein [Burkholderiales bacterium]|nr:polysaccharide deacetylase family protein [Burkholderiales bacterium]
MRRASSACALACLAWAAAVHARCDRPVYLTFDTGHMGVASLVAEVLARQHVKATFFLANEPTLDGGTSLDDHWAPWWRARAAEGHLFASHTYDHVYWRADLADGTFEMRPSAGPQAGRTLHADAAAYCTELQRSADRFHAMTGATMAKLFRAPGGKTSPALLAAARSCGYTHVPWTPAGFLGDELPSERWPNERLLARALRDVRSGDILLVHLGIRSRHDPWAPAVLEPLIVGLKQKGLCFATLREHPVYGAVLDGPGIPR